MAKVNRYLIIRFSSIGDIVQALSIPSVIKTHDPQSSVDFLTRSDLCALCENHPKIEKIFKYEKRTGFKGLLSLASELRKREYTHIYDVHNNLRSRIICFLLNGLFGWKRIVKGHHFLRRSNSRIKRFFLFTFHINFFEKPFAQQRSIVAPLKKWDMPTALPSTPQFFLTPEETEWARCKISGAFTALAPSASYALKRWPKDYWVTLCKTNPEVKFVILGGPADKEELEDISGGNVVNLVGELNLRQSAAIIAQSSGLISNDTGMLHIAEQLGKPCLALMGPAPFGYPSRLESTKIIERDLKCKPCSKHGQGPCTNPNFHECMRSISVEEVSQGLKRIGHDTL